MKYIVFVNHGVHEGWSIQGTYNTLREAVDEAIANSYGSEFKIVQEVGWKPLKE